MKFECDSFFLLNERKFFIHNVLVSNSFIIVGGNANLLGLMIEKLVVKILSFRDCPTIKRRRYKIRHFTVTNFGATSC